MSQSTPSPLTPAAFDVEVFFDGGCPLCVREINMLRGWDRHRRIQFTDIDSADFSAEAYGKTDEDLMSRIQGRLTDGSWIEGVEVFRRLYSAVGFGPVVWITRLPGISQMMTLGYKLFARNRLRLTGRCMGKSCAVPCEPVATGAIHNGVTPHE